MDEREFGARLDRAQADFYTRRLVALVELPVLRPAPAHDHALGPFDLQELAGALVLDAIRGAKAHAEAAADPRVHLGAGDRTIVRPPPRADAFCSDQRFEHDARPRGDPSDQAHTDHRSRSCALRSLSSAYVASRSRLV